MKKIIYLKQEVKLGDVIDFHGLKAVITQELVDQNPEVFYVEEETPEYVKLLESFCGFIKGDIAVVVGRDDGYLINVPGRRSTSAYYPNIWINSKNIEMSSKEAFDRQELLKEAQRRYPVGTKFITLGYSGDVYTVEGKPLRWNNCYKKYVNANDKYGILYSEGQWAEIVTPLFTTEDGVDIFVGDEIHIVNLLSYTIDSRKKGWLRGWIPDRDNKVFSTKEAAQKFIDDNKEKTLEDYENTLLKSNSYLKGTNFNQNMDSNWFWATLKANEPRLYWIKVLSLIQQDLENNEEFNFDWDHIFYTISSSTHTNTNTHCGGDEGAIYFSTQENAIKASKLIGNKIYKNK